MLSIKDTAMNQTLENVSKAEVNVDIENATIDRDENLAKIEIATLAIIFLVTVLGNSTVLLALWTRRRYAGRKKLSRMYFFILHLSIADLITAFLSVLPQLGWEVTYRFNGGFVLCKVVKYGQTLGPYLSSYVLMATAIDRHQAICYPLTYCSWTSRRSKVMVWLAWAASLAFCIPQVFHYTPSEGTSNKGHLYERKLTALFALRLCNANKQFFLLFNTRGFDKWDDVVIFIREGERKKLNCFQLKHVTGSSNAVLRLDMFEMKQNKTKCICELKKLFAGYQKIKSSLPIMENDILRNIDIDDVNLILFTNMKGKLSVDGNNINECNELFQTKNRDEDEESITIDLSHLKNKLENEEQREEFFRQWLYSGSQANEKELDILIKKELELFLNLKKDAFVTEVFKHYLEYIDLWTDGKLNEFHSLTPKHIHVNLAEILISTLEIIVPSDEMLECSEELPYTEWNTIIANKSLIVLKSSDFKIQSFIYTAILKSQTILEIPLVKKILKDEIIDIKNIMDTLNEYESELCCYLSKDIESNLYIPKSTKFLLWKLGLIPLIIKIRNIEDMQILRATLTIAKEKRIKIIAITDPSKNGFQIETTETSMNYLADINNENISIIHNKCIKLNGHSFNLRELMEKCPKLNTSITTDNVIQILTNSCNGSNTFHYKTPKEKFYHISRQIPAIGLNTEILKFRADILIIYGDNATVRSLEYIPDVDVSGCWEDKIGNELTKDTLDRHRILLFANTNDHDSYNKFKRVCNLTNKNVHLVKLHLFGETVLLQWIRTSKSVEVIRKFRISSEKLPKLEVTSIKGIVNILSADPGYGKTEMMYQLARQQTQNLIVFITLADQPEYFLKTEKSDPIEHLRYFFYPNTVEDDLYLNIFNAFLSSRQILVIIDGMDEISTECKNKVVKFIQEIIDIDIKIWITCRVCVQEELENEVNTIAFTLNTFNEMEQKEFLSKYNFTNDEIGKILSNKQDLLEIPLYLYMLCESSSDFSNMLRLCDDFIQTEIEKYCKKLKERENLIKYLTDRLNKFVKEYALYNSFPKHLINHLLNEESFKNDIEFFIASGYTSFGLIRKYNVNDQYQYVFVHKEICDYIAANALVDIKDARDNVTLMEYLFNEKLTSLRSMFFKILVAKNGGNTLMQAILDNNHVTASAYLTNYVENINEDFTTSLHLAAQWGRRHYYPTDTALPFAEQRCFRSKETGTEQIMKLLLKNISNVENLINEKDKFLSWSPIQYADHSASLGILEEFSTIETFDICSSELLKKMPQSVLLYFCIKYHYNNLFRLLFQGSELDLSSYCTESGNTLLHIASESGNSDILDILLDNISPTVLNKQKETPLHVAAYGHQTVVSVLIAKDAHLEVSDNNGYTPLHRAVKCGQEEIVKLLIANKADLTTYTLNGYSLVHTAAYCNNVSILTILIESGASINECDNDGNFPLHTAVEWNSVDCIEVLVKKTLDLDKVNKRGNTPLELAIESGQLQVVKMLISNGANVNIIDYSLDMMLPSIANYLKPLVQKEFTGRSGVDSDQDFELKMLALMSLRFCGANTEKMFTAMHFDECGIFSDIVLHHKQKNADNVTYLIQLKHQKNPKNITRDEFEADDGNYSLLNYAAEIEKLKKIKYSAKTSRLVNFLNNSLVNLILFTNRNLDWDNYKYLQKIRQKELFPIIMNTEGNIYKIKLESMPENFNELNENLYLFTDQISADNIDNFLENAFIQLISSFKLPSKIIKQYIKDYLIYVSRWAQGKLGGYGFLSKKHIITFLTDLCLSPYIKIYEHDDVNWPEQPNRVSEMISEAISGSEPYTVINSSENTQYYLYQEIIGRLEKYWNNVPVMETWTKYFPEDEQAVFYKNNQSNKHHLFRIVGNFGRLNLLHLYKCMWIEGKIPLVVEFTSKQDYEKILNIQKLSDGALKLVLLNRTESVMTP